MLSLVMQDKKIWQSANKAKSVNITCKLAQTMVSVSCSETFKSTFAGYTCYIEGADALSIPFVEDEARAAYVKAGQPLTVSGDFVAEGVFLAKKSLRKRKPLITIK